MALQTPENIRTTVILLQTRNLRDLSKFSKRPSIRPRVQPNTGRGVPLVSPCHPAFLCFTECLSLKLTTILIGTISPLKTAVYVDSCTRLPIPQVAQTSTLSYICSWITWGISVAVCSFFISALMRGRDGNTQPYGKCSGQSV